MLNLAKGSLWFLDLLCLTCIWEIGTSLFLQKCSAHGTENRKDGLSGEQGIRTVDKSCAFFCSAIVLLTLAQALCPLLKWGYYFSSSQECYDNEIAWYWGSALRSERSIHKKGFDQDFFLKDLTFWVLSIIANTETFDCTVHRHILLCIESQAILMFQKREPQGKVCTIFCAC